MRAYTVAAAVISFGAVVGASACKNEHGADTTSKGVDTVVTSVKVKDTTVVRADTTIHTDTVKQTHHLPDAKKP